MQSLLPPPFLSRRRLEDGGQLARLPSNSTSAPSRVKENGASVRIAGNRRNCNQSRWRGDKTAGRTKCLGIHAHDPNYIAALAEIRRADMTRRQCVSAARFRHRAPSLLLKAGRCTGASSRRQSRLSFRPVARQRQKFTELGLWRARTPAISSPRDRRTRAGVRRSLWRQMTLLGETEVGRKGRQRSHRAARCSRLPP